MFLKINSFLLCSVHTIIGSICEGHFIFPGGDKTSALNKPTSVGAWVKGTGLRYLMGLICIRQSSLYKGLFKPLIPQPQLSEKCSFGPKAHLCKSMLSQKPGSQFWNDTLSVFAFEAPPRNFRFVLIVAARVDKSGTVSSGTDLV